MKWFYRVLVGVLLASCGLMRPLPSHAATFYGRPHRYVEDDLPATSTPLPVTATTETPGSDLPLPPEPAETLLDAINLERIAVGALPLILDARESQCSQVHSQHMAMEGHLSHDDYPADLCVPNVTNGENIGESYGSPRDAVLYLNTLMLNEGPCPDQPCTGDELETHGHYFNLLNPLYTHVGIGIYYGDNGVTWLTEDFTG